MSKEQRSIFHLSFPVRSLAQSIPFYQRCLGAELGRVTEAWVDIILFGHQLTLHERPDQVLAREARGVRHFGAILSWEQWQSTQAKVIAYDAALAAGLTFRETGTPEEHVKLLLDDPDGNLVELKAYKTLATVSAALGLRE